MPKIAMPKNGPTPLHVAADGLAAGAVGALALTGTMLAGRTLTRGAAGPHPHGPEAGFTAGEALSDTPSVPPSMNEITATFVQKIATGLFGTSLSRDQQFAAGVAWHLTYGGFWGLLYALLQSSVPVPRAALGPLFGLGLWALGPGWLAPQMKVMLPPSRQEPRARAIVIGGHIVYGVLLAFGTRLLAGKER
jgi:hypothetical protein